MNIYYDNRSNDLSHASYKYVKREWKNGRWNYTYEDDKEHKTLDAKNVKTLTLAQQKAFVADAQYENSVANDDKEDDKHTNAVIARKIRSRGNKDRRTDANRFIFKTSAQTRKFEDIAKKQNTENFRDQIQRQRSERVASARNKAYNDAKKKEDREKKKQKAMKFVEGLLDKIF